MLNPEVISSAVARFTAGFLSVLRGFSSANLAVKGFCTWSRFGNDSLILLNPSLSLAHDAE